MLGYWDSRSPLKIAGPSGCALLRATAFVIPGNRTLLAIASWAPEPVACHLTVDWKALGLQLSNATAPALGSLQQHRQLDLETSVAIGNGSGLVLWTAR